MKVHKINDCGIIVAQEPSDKKGMIWHMSISCKDRNPTWEEIRDAWYKLVPNAKNITGAMYFPPEEEYVNVHQHCFHVYEVKK